jgi:hypothetical protein
MSIKLNSSGGGSVTIQEPTTASAYTLTLPAVTATALTDSSGVLNIGSGQVYKDASGNVGIGTSSPSAKLQVNGIIQSGATGTNGNVQFLRSSDGAAAGSLSWDSTNTALAMNNGVGTGVLTFLTNSTERMRIDSSGNVGIGKSATGGNRLDVNGTGNFDGGITLANNTWVNCKNTSGTVRDSFGYFTDNFLYVTAWDGAMILRAGGATERMRISSNGNIGVGSNNPGSKFTSYQSAVNNNIESSSPSSGMTHYLVSTSLGTGGGSDALGVYDAGGLSARITTNGYFQSRPNSYGSTSDERLKDNIVDATPKLADIMQVRVRNFNYKDQPQEKQLGVIAQELENVFPGLVHEIPNSNPELTNADTVKSVKYSVFVPMLIKAIQELKVELDATKAEVAALKGTV